jgi:LPXTG-site transpeptidase (sortase) family protein
MEGAGGRRLVEWKGVARRGAPKGMQTNHLAGGDDAPAHRLSRRRVLVGVAALPWLLAGCARALSSDVDGLVQPAVVRTIARTAPNLADSSEPTPVPAGPPTRLEIPKIKLDTPVVELGWHAATDRDGQIFSEWDVAEYAAGWHKNSARPGEPGNVVLSGHNNILGAVFRELDQLRAGDAVVLWAEERAFAYTIEQVVVVPETHASDEQRAENARWIAPFEDDRLTLVSCWPRNNNTHRIIVVARPEGN